ncbi:MarR family winged helix-turn-helix transcriptional regulator [Candidatus Soleaferrea massiliensis]|uniref:MarR family winged helix-turn-helix transcriptional regulator n=1 Tax=Candidatus Soleaferrea massiliensis TaxID=1470354 RepID=UPI00058B32D4|nr:MarR family winged helix-turn-helix transcriptional regulator [Candidatus Soleaferrea massiliensis]
MQDLTAKEQIALFNENCRAIDKLYEQYAKSVGLTFLGMTILEMIYLKPDGCTQKRICEDTHLPKQTVNVVIKSFWKQGYVELVEIESDRRNKAIRLSPSGLEYAEKIMDRMAKAEEAAWEQLSQEQRQTIVDSISRYEEAFKEHIQIV